MFDFFSDDARRDPYPVYDQMRAGSPVLRVPAPFDAWLIFDFEGVKRALYDHDTFSSQVPAPRHWFLFLDPPSHTKLRVLISRAFTSRSVAGLEPRIRELSRQLLDQAIERGEMDLAAEFSVSSSETPAASTSRAIPTRTSRSGTAFIRAWGRHSHAWRPGSPSRTCSGG